MKAGQLSRHSCNQILRGRYQHAKIQAGPEHQTRQPAGEGRQRGQRKEPPQRRADNKGSNRAHTSTARSATKPGRQRGAPTGAQKQHNPTSPGGQLMQGTTRPPTRQRAAQTIFVQSIMRLTKVRQEANRKENKEKGRAQNKKERNKEMNWRSTSAPVTSTDRHASTEKTKPEHHTLGRIGHQCTCHVYGQIRQWK